MEVVRPLEKNPDEMYSSGATGAIFVLMEQPFAPAYKAAFGAQWSARS